MTFDLNWRDKTLFFNGKSRSKNDIDRAGLWEEIKESCNKFQEDSGASDIEVKTLLRELARVWEKEN